MFLLGMLSVLQISFLPGYLIVRALRMDNGAIKTWILSFTLSVLFNHWLIVALVTAHSYYSLTVYAIFAVELGILGWMEFAGLGTPIAVLCADDQKRVKELCASFNEGDPATRWLGTSVLLAAAVTLLIYLMRFMEADHVFSAWDAVVSWNRWAVDWYQNRFPSRTHQYPQLIPSNWSISYVFMGSATVQLFAKMLMPLFPLTALLAATDLGLRSKNLGIILGVSLTGFLFLSWGGDLIDSGYVDTPLACMAFTAIYMLLLAKEATTDIQRQKHFFVGVILCAGAALTKQPGLYLAGIYPLLAFILVLNQTKSSFMTKAKTVAMAYCLLIVLVAPWNLYTWSLAISGEDPNVLPALTGRFWHEGRALAERIVFATTSIAGTLGSLTTYVLIPLGLFSVALRRTWRWLLAGLFVPWFLVWSTLVSYDIRNLALVVPLVGVAAGLGLYDIVSRYGRRPLMYVVREGRVAAIVLVIIASVILSLRYSGTRLVRHQLELQRNIGNAVLNRSLYEFHEKTGIKGKIATAYEFLGYLPGLEKYSSYLHSGTDVSIDQFLDKLEEAKAAYLLWRPSDSNQPIRQYIQQKISSGDYTTIFDVDGFKLLSIRHDNLARIN